MWGKGSPRFEGRTLTVEAATCYPRPLQERIPILVGGSGERARFGSSPATPTRATSSATRRGRAQVGVLHEHCATEGRDPAEVRITHLAPARVIADGEERTAGRGDGSEHVGRFREFAEAGVQTAIVGARRRRRSRTPSRRSPTSSPRSAPPPDVRVCNARRTRETQRVASSEHRGDVMFIRVVRFEGTSAERIDGLIAQVDEAGGPPPGVNIEKLTVLFDEAQSTAVVLQHFATKEDMDAGAAVFAAMDPSETPGTRASVDMLRGQARARGVTATCAWPAAPLLLRWLRRRSRTVRREGVQGRADRLRAADRRRRRDARDRQPRRPWRGDRLRLARRRGGPWVHHLASVLYLAAGVAYRFAWVGAGRTSAAHHEAVARNTRTPNSG